MIWKAKAMLEKVCQFMVAVVRPLSGRTARQPMTSADEGDEERLDQEREDDGGGAETEGAHGSDFAAAFGDRGVHGVESAKDRANGHDGGDETAQNGD